MNEGAVDGLMDKWMDGFLSNSVHASLGPDGHQSHNPLIQQSPLLVGLGGAWRTAGILHQLGLLPLYTNRVLDCVRDAHGEVPPASLLEEFALVRSALVGFWRPVTCDESHRSAIHVFIGPPGSGKTTALCKWLTKSVLVQGRSVRVWRLDGGTAHLPGLLDFHAEVLGIPVEREWQPNPAEYDLGFIDLPAPVPNQDQTAEILRALPSAEIHLVLNAAYDAPILLAQARAFSALPVHDVIFTHLDEETRLAKLWNIVLGTNFTVRFLAAGQNIPGDFFKATAERLIPPQIRG
jgi:hypothetical protein